MEPVHLSHGTNAELKKVEILRGYEVLPNNNVRFGIRIINNTDAVITDVQVILDYNESLFKLEDEKVQKLDSIPPAVPRTIKFVLKPLGCVHKEFIEATITYRDHKWEKHVISMSAKEVHCVCPFLKAKPIAKSEYLEKVNKGHSVETGINFQGVSTSELTSYLMQTCANRLHKVDEYTIADGKVLYFSSESLGEKAYYLLTVLIKDNIDMTQVMFRAASDKKHGIHGFLNEIVSELKHMIHMESSAKEIGIIRNEQVINIIDSVVQRSSFSLDGKASVKVEDSIVQRSEVHTENNTPVNAKDSATKDDYLRAINQETATSQSQPSSVKKYSTTSARTLKSNGKKNVSKRKVLFSIVVLFVGAYIIDPSLTGVVYGLIVVASVIWVIYDIITNNKDLDSTKKALWILAVLMFGLLGMVVYYFLGRNKDLQEK